MNLILPEIDIYFWYYPYQALLCDMLHAIYYYYLEIILLLLQYLGYITITLPAITITITITMTVRHHFQSDNKL